PPPAAAEWGEIPMLPVPGPPTSAGTRDDKSCTNPPNSLSVMPMMRASHSFDAPLGDAERNGGALASFKGPATALTWPCTGQPFIDLRAGQGDRVRSNFLQARSSPARTNRPGVLCWLCCRSGSVPGANWTPVRRRSSTWRRQMNMNRIDVGAMSQGAKAALQCQKDYFNTNITKSFAWRLEQLDRLSRMLSENMNAFSEAVGSDFKTALSEKVVEVAG